MLCLWLSMNTQFMKYRQALNKQSRAHPEAALWTETQGGEQRTLGIRMTLLSFCPTLAPVRYNYDIS